MVTLAMEEQAGGSPAPGEYGEPPPCRHEGKPVEVGGELASGTLRSAVAARRPSHMKILITGGGGFIGSRLASALLGRQAVARPEPPRVDLLGEALGELVREALGDERRRHGGRSAQGGGSGRHGGLVIIQIGSLRNLPVCPHGEGVRRC
jgi:hypothetical protein